MISHNLDQMVDNGLMNTNGSNGFISVNSKNSQIKIRTLFQIFKVYAYCVINLDNLNFKLKKNIEFVMA